tara:strand:- start:3336 stop:4178 length:843 start_codon:yes stop_codon:yes gene_type:complete
MRFNLHEKFGALNSKPVFDAFHTGANALGHDVVINGNDGIDVIWSVLWNGRMAGNRSIWERNISQSKPTIVLEVGGIQRGSTWKVGLNGINRDGDYIPSGANNDRARLLGLELQPWRYDGEYILIAGQHDKSLQWQDMPPMSNWIIQTIEKLRKHTSRPIVFRPHPRCSLPHIEKEFKNVYRQDPVQVKGSYDDFDLGFKNIFATVNWSSNPAIHSVLQGVPAFTGPSSLAYDVTLQDLNQIENPLYCDRQQWLNDYAHTEYTVEEISQGIPIKHLTSLL